MYDREQFGKDVENIMHEIKNDGKEITQPSELKKKYNSCDILIK